MAVELLLVEDDPDHVELCRRSLDRTPPAYRVTVAGDLIAAQDWLAAHTPDLVLADLRLPGGVATDLLAGPGSALPLVVMTCQGDQDRAVAAMKAGALDYVVKSAETFQELPGIVERALRSARHVRDRIAAEEQLRQSEERFRQLAENIDGVFWLYDVRSASFIYASPAWERVFGTTVDALLGDAGVRSATVHPDDREEYATHLGTPDPESPRQASYRVVTPGGLVRWVEERTFPVTDLAGGSRRVAGLVTDITSRRSLEAALQHSQKLDALGRLAGGIAHDFNNVLGVITGYAHLILEGRDATATQYAREIASAGDRAAALTKQLLAFSRNQVIAPVRTNLNRVLSDLRKMLDRLIGGNIKLQYHLAHQLGDIRGDVGQLEQVAMNLIVNARDAMPRGGRITMATADLDILPGERFGETEPPPGAYVQLTVEDTGCGMTAEVLARVFEPFFTTKEVGKGTGLGLATVYGIVKQAGGHIQIQSRIGVGTRFDILFPLAGSSTPERGTPAPPQAAIGGSEVILLAEDDPQVRDFLTRSLAALGYTVIPTTDGEEALAEAARRRGTIDLILSDVRMPRMSGTQLAKEVRRLYPRMLLVLMTGFAPDESAEQLHTLPDAVLSKPFTVTTVATRMRELFATRGAGKPGRRE